MSNNATTVAGIKVGFCATLPSAEDQAGYEALASTPGYEEGGCYITSVGDIGRTWNEVSSKYVCSRQEKSRKGSYKWKPFSLDLDRDFSDAAQMILEDAEAGDDEIPVRITLPTGHKIYFTALVMEMPLATGDADQTIRSTVTLQPNSTEMLRVDP